jgi:hypothetical protein
MKFQEYHYHRVLLQSIVLLVSKDDENSLEVPIVNAQGLNAFFFSSY